MMTARADLMLSVVDRIKTTLVGLRMPRALEIVDAIVRQLERGEVARDPAHQDLAGDGQALQHQDARRL